MALRPTSSPGPREPRVLAGRYRLGARRGTGVDAAVFDAFDLAEQRLVAVKLVHPDLSADDGFQRRFRATMDATSHLRHPSVASVLDWGTETWNGRPVLFTVVEHLGGGSLRDLLDRGRLLSPSQALVVGLDACKALDVVHRRGLVHGDVRPSTLVFGDDGRLRLVDVGLGLLLVEQLWGDPSRMPNDRAAYAAPETAVSGERGAPADVYALCLTLMESVTGKVPFAGDSTVATLANRVDRLLPVSADLGPLATVLERAGRPSPDERSTAAELGRGLVQVAEKLPRPAPLELPGGGLFDARGDATGSLARTYVPSEPVEPEPAPPPVPAEVVPAPVVAGPSVEPRRPPRARWRSWRVLVPGVALAVLLALVLAWIVTRPGSSEVPDLAGLTEAEALNQVAGRGWSVVVTTESSDVVPAGVVIRTQPPAGTSLREGGELQLVVSSGSAPRALPELVGLTLDEARALLAAQDLVLDEGPPVYDESVPEGRVVSWSVPEQPNLRAGDTVTKGTTVRVVRSAGPAPRTVPPLEGLTLEAATAALAVLDLTITVLPDEFSATVPIGAVVRSEPAAGQNVAKGGAVAVVLSRGPDLVAMPSLAGLDHAGVRAALQAAGLVVGTVTGDTNLNLLGATAGGAPVSTGQLLPRGTVVDLQYAVPPPG